jgi:hypothetical protein
MNTFVCAATLRAERRAAHKLARALPLGEWPTYPSVEGLP